MRRNYSSKNNNNYCNSTFTVKKLFSLYYFEHNEAISNENISKLKNRAT